MAEERREGWQRRGERDGRGEERREGWQRRGERGGRGEGREMTEEPPQFGWWIIQPLSFKQIADFVEMHELEIQGIADGDVAAGVKGFDPIGNNQLTQEELDKAQADPAHKLTLKYYAAAVGEPLLLHTLPGWFTQPCFLHTLHFIFLERSAACLSPTPARCGL